MLTLSICVVAYNEESFLPNLLEDIKLQKYPHEHTEIVLVNSMSTDDTRRIMEDFANSNTEFYAVQVLDNPKKTQAAGWNVAISGATGDVIARIDAHTKLPAEYSKRVMEEIERGEDVVGGVRPCVIENETAWGKVLLETENSLFGSSINKSRRSQEKTYVKTMFHAAYRKEVFEKVGLFNESLLRTEDNEMHYRIREAGYKLCYDPSIVSYQYARSNLKRMLKQKYGNGKWVGITLKVCPGCLSLYHFVPFCFLLGIIATTAFAFFGLWQLAALMWGAYLLFTLLSMAIVIINGDGNRWTFCMPILFLILHLDYGAGTAIGLLTMHKKRKK